MARFTSLLYLAKRYRFVFTRSLWLLTLGIGNRNGRRQLKKVAHALGHSDRQPQLPQIEAEQLLGPDVAIELRTVARTGYNVSAVELAMLSAMVARLKPRRIFEIGTFDGRTTIHLAANTDADAQVFTIDLPPGTVTLPYGVSAGQLLEGFDRKHKITQLFGNSLDYDFSPYQGTIDFVFVDAGHGYENVRNDSQVALKLIGDRQGAIFWHDYATFSGVTRAVDELIPELQGRGTFAWIEGTTLACLVCTRDTKQAESISA